MNIKHNTINQVYVIVIFLIGLFLSGYTLFTFSHFPIFPIIVLGLFATVAESLSVPIGDRYLSVSSAITLCGLIAYGPVGALVPSVLSILLRIKKDAETGKTKHIFNTPVKLTMANFAFLSISSVSCSLAYISLGGRVLDSSLLPASPSIDLVLAAISQQSVYILTAIFIEMLVNTLLFSGYLNTLGRGQILQEWAYDFFWSFAGLLVVGLIGVLITAFYLTYEWFVAMTIFAPLFLARYTFSLYSNLRVSYMDTVKSLSDAIEAKDQYTRGHSQRVQEYSAMIADELHFTPPQKEILQYSALLHDVGKIGVTEAILNKKGKLDTIEWDTIMQHPVMGARIIANVKYLKECVPIIKYHHKNYDGTGYPEVSSAEKVPFESYILGVADAYDAMTSKRLYREPFSQEKALAEIKRCTGTQFSPVVAEAFHKVMTKNQTPIQTHYIEKKTEQTFDSNAVSR